MNLILSLSNPDILPDQIRTKQVEFGASGGSIGRSEDCDWVLDDPDRFVSSKHVKVVYKKDGFYVEDISTNGTYLNDQLIGKGNRLPVVTGDVLRVGRFIMAAEQRDNNGSIIGIDKTPDPFKLSPESDQRADQDDLLADAGSASDIDDLLGEPSKSSSKTLMDFDGPLPTSSHMPGIKDTLPPLMQQDPSGAIPEDWWKKGADETGEPLEIGSIDNDLEIQENLDDKVEIFELDPVPAEETKIILEPEPTSEPIVEAKPDPKPEPTPIKAKSTPKQKTKPKPAPKKRVKASIEGDFAKDFLAAVALAEDDVSADSGDILGSVLCELLSGTLDLLDARSRMRNELRLQSTMVGARENNPLKFSINYQDAIGRLLKGESTGFKDPIVATEEVMADLKEHHLAMFAGIDAGVKALLLELDPKHIMAGKGLLAMPTLTSKMIERHAAITEDTVERTGGVFWRAFSDAYQNAISAARTNRMLE